MLLSRLGSGEGSEDGRGEQQVLEIYIRYLIKYRATIPLPHDWEMGMRKWI